MLIALLCFVYAGSTAIKIIIIIVVVVVVVVIVVVIIVVVVVVVVIARSISFLNFARGLQKVRFRVSCDCTQCSLTRFI